MAWKEKTVMIVNCQECKELIMKRKRGRPKGSTSKKRKNINHNFRGAEDRFFAKIVRGIDRFLETPFK